MINWQKINFKNRTSGSFKTQCPQCLESDRTNKRDTSLAVNLDKGMAYCHYCLEPSFKESNEPKQKRNTNYLNKNGKTIQAFQIAS